MLTSEQIHINIKPMSVNSAWKGRRFSTPEYVKYTRDVLFLLPKIQLPDKPYKLYLEFGLSNKCNDIDNGVKPLTDILCKKYNFDDRDIYDLHIKKVITEKGKEYIKFKIEHYDLS